MRCPRCKSPRIQRDYDDSNILLRLVRLHKLLCNNCGLVFKGFDPLGKQRRSPSKYVNPIHNRRRGPRYHAHLPAAISLIDETDQTGQLSYSQPSRGHCDTISKFGMGVSLVGTRFPEEELSRTGRLLFVRVDLPDGVVNAVVRTITQERVGSARKRKWFLGVKLHQISDADADLLAAYLEKRAKAEPLVISD